jgi:hypothetical protein
VVAAGGFEPCAEDIFKYFADLEGLLNYKNVLD